MAEDQRPTKLLTRCLRSGALLCTGVLLLWFLLLVLLDSQLEGGFSLPLILLLIGLLGYGMIVVSCSSTRSLITVYLFLGTVAFFTVAAFHLIGYDLAESNLILEVLPRPHHVWWERPASWNYPGFDPEEFQDYLIGSWLEVVEVTPLNIAPALLLCGLCASRMKGATIMIAAVLISGVGVPLIIAWEESGWLDNFDFRDDLGGGYIHVLAGSCALTLVLACRFLTPHRGFHPSLPLPRPANGPALSRRNCIIMGAGYLLFLVWPVSLTLSQDLLSSYPDVESLTTGLLMFFSGLTALVTCIVIRKRSYLLVVMISTMAGWAASASNDDPVVALATGIAIGTIVPLVLYWMDSHGFDDPLGLVVAHFLGGSIGLIATVLWEHLEIFATDGVSSQSFWGSLLAQLILIAAITLVGMILAGIAAVSTWVCGGLWEPRGGAFQAPGLMPDAERPEE